MKSTTVALGFLTGVSSAAYNHPRHFHSPPRFYRRDNGTNSYPVEAPPAAEAQQTTLTVAVTNYHTVISCAATVTNCPANSNNTAAMSTMPASDLVTKVQTSIVDLYTTVCPVTAAESVSKSVVQAHSSGYITGTPVPPPGESVSESVGTTDAVITMTVGPSSAQSVVTKTIKSTYTARVTITKGHPGAPKETSGNSPVGEQPGKQNNGGNDYPVAPKPTGPAGASAHGPEGTTTMTSTTTGTRTVTVNKPSTATQNAPLPTGNGKTPNGQQPGTSNPSNPGTSGNSPECNCPAAPAAAEANCPAPAAPVTVTVTAPASTVYMTAPAAAATGANSPSTGSGSNNPAAPGAQQPSTGSGSNKPATGSNAGYPAQPQQPATGSDKPAAPGAEGDDDNCEAEDENVTVSATATVVPYPTGASNGTIAHSTGAIVPGAAKPTGATLPSAPKSSSAVTPAAAQSSSAVIPGAAKPTGAYPAAPAAPVGGSGYATHGMN
ncbi:hypothetical protein PG996_004057 [Apiospora saccharicola]|uniref:Uncharacterized protein n=1 Tax=Apiospora saccharicola TaxID=335842 RepID=A0ABR1W4B0_9PEZI